MMVHAPQRGEPGDARAGGSSRNASGRVGEIQKKGESPWCTLGLGLIPAVPGDAQANKTHLSTPFSFQVLPGLRWYLCSNMRNVFCSALVVLLDLYCIKQPIFWFIFFPVIIFHVSWLLSSSPAFPQAETKQDPVSELTALMCTGVMRSPLSPIFLLSCGSFHARVCDAFPCSPLSLSPRSCCHG